MKRIALFLVIISLLLGIIVSGCNGGGDSNGENGYVPPPPTPASFSLSNLSIEPLEALPGEMVTITATLTNTGGTSGSYDVTINIDSIEGDTHTITVGPGSNQNVVFEVHRDNSASYEVAVGNLSGSFTVLSGDLVLEAAFEAMAGINTLQFDMESYTTLTETDDSETSTSTITIHGAVDITGSQAYQTSTEDYDNGLQIITE